MEKYDIFISYRREGGYDTAKHLYDLLTRDGYRVSFDIDTLRNGDFDTQLYKRIDSCADFILVVDQHAFDRTIINKIPREKDWLRCELAYALHKNKNIIPIFLTGINKFPDNLPNDIVGVIKKNGPEYNRYYFDEFYRTLKKRFLHDNRNVIKKWIIVLLLGCITCCCGLVIMPLIYNFESEQYPSIPPKNRLYRPYNEQGISNRSDSDSLRVTMKCDSIKNTKKIHIEKNDFMDSSTGKNDVNENIKQKIVINDNSPKRICGQLAGHEWVDLGLSVKWATHNIGASSISDYGDYFAWGEITPKSSYSPNNYTFPQKNDIGGSEFDAARILWGKPWRMPTEKEVEELKRCKREWTSVNGIKGCLIIGKNGNTIFLPANGSSNYWNKGERGDYWSSTKSASESSSGIYFNIKNNLFVIAHGSNWAGSGIRPVFN